MNKLIIIILLIFNIVCFSQTNRIDSIKNKLENLSQTYPALNEKVSISVSEVSIQEFIRGIAKTTKVNINVSPELNFQVINNFSDVKVVDILIFLIKEYNLDLDITGNIISISKHKIPDKKPKPPKIKPLKIEYNKKDSLLSVDLRKDSLFKVVRTLIEKTGENLIISPGLENKVISSFIKNKPFNQAIKMIAYANNLNIYKNDQGFYIIEPNLNTVNKNKPNKVGKNNKKSNTKKTNKRDIDSELKLEVISYNDISIYATNTPIYEIIKKVSDQLGIGYYFLSELKSSADLNVSHINYEELLDNLFDGTEDAYYKQKNIFLFGEKKINEINETQVIELQYRTVENVTDIIPENLKKDLTIKEFLDLNSLIVTGTKSRINDLDLFIREIDKVVPVILIEVLIVNVSKNYTQTIGVEAGLDANKVPAQTTGSFSGVNMNLSTSTINNLINSFNGFGWFNIGKVTPEFYLSIKALEENGIIKLSSTPMLSTLNGQEANLKIGEKQYYYEEKQNTIGTQNPQNIKTGTWKPVTADLNIKIKPIVSGDEQVTLEIEVSQSDFTGKVSKDAPPGSVDRTFKSLIRIKNQEMILLGGLENKKKSQTSSGIPFLSRIPVIKWILGSTTKTDNYSKLTIFIKPTVIY